MIGAREHPGPDLKFPIGAPGSRRESSEGLGYAKPRTDPLSGLERRRRVCPSKAPSPGERANAGKALRRTECKERDRSVMIWRYMRHSIADEYLVDHYPNRLERAADGLINVLVVHG